MESRQFLQNSSLVAIRIMASPSFILLPCNKVNMFDSTEHDGKILIIGAGAAGYLLKKQYDVNFQIIEASGNHGGRMSKNEIFADFSIDLGAQWLRGRNNILDDLIKKNGTKITRDNSDNYFWSDGQVRSDLLQEIFAIYEQSYLQDISYFDHASNHGIGPEYQGVIRAIAGSKGADPSKLSCNFNAINYENWSSGATDFKFEDAIYDFIDTAFDTSVKYEILLNTILSSIDYSGEKIFLTDSNSNIYGADKVIMTLPITILQDWDINFSPALPAEKTKAFSKIGMGPGRKVWLKLSSKFHQKNTTGGIVWSAYADDSVGKTGGDNVLLCFAMGNQAQELHNLGSDSAILSALLAELDARYNGQATVNFQDSVFIDWTAQPFISGAYGYSTIGMGADSRKKAAESIDGKIFFAGEAMSLKGHHQTVHGALEIGYREVVNIYEFIQE